MGLGGRRYGASLGPQALRIAGLERELSRVVSSYRDRGDVLAPESGESFDRGEGIGNFERCLMHLKTLREGVYGQLARGETPVVLGGDHSLSIGTLSAASEYADGGLGVLWIDAHADLNTPDTSPSGNLHGMSLAAVAKLACGGGDVLLKRQWEKLLGDLVPHGLDLRKVVWLGLRDVDAGERERLAGGHLMQAITMHEIDRDGITRAVEHAVEVFRRHGATQLWVSFDADVYDPYVAPGTGTIVRGGLSYRESHLLGELLYEYLVDSNRALDLLGVDVAEVNPTLDSGNMTAVTCVEWLASLFGKRILPPNHALS
jgi:arginase